MEIVRKVMFIGFICLIFNSGYSQSGFYKRLTAGSFVQANGVIQLADSSYVVTGSAGGFDEASGQAFLMKLDSLGNFLWSKDYGGIGDEVGVRVIHKEGEGFYIAGYTSSTENADFDFMLMKTDEDGAFLWEKKYGGSDWEILHDAVLLDDGIVLVGEVEGLYTQGKDIYMVRTDLDGDTLWTKTISTPEEDIAYAVTLITDENFLVGGVLGEDGIAQGFLASYHVDGSENWINFDNTEGVTVIKDVAVYDGNIFSCGGLYDIDTLVHDIYYAKYDMSGNQMESFKGDYVFNSSPYFGSLVIRDDSEGSIYLSMQISASDESVEYYPGGYDARVLRFSTLWMFYLGPTYFFSGYDDNYVNQMIVSHDGGIVIVGTVSDMKENFSLGSQGMLVKIPLSGTNPNEPDYDPDYIDLLNVNEEKNQTFLVHPNPTTKTVKIPDEVIGSDYQLSNAQGQTIKNGTLSSTLSLEHIESGLYFLKVSNEKGIWTSKILKQ